MDMKTLRVRDLMTRDVDTLDANENIATAAEGSTVRSVAVE